MVTSLKPLLIIQNHPIESAGRINTFLDEQSIPYETIHPYNGDQFPDLDSHSAIITMGCPTPVSEFQSQEWSRNLFDYLDLIFEKQKSYLGLCYGSQIMAANRGASVLPNDGKEIGVYQVTLNADGKADPLFAGFPETFPVFHWHGDTFGIPAHGKLLARGEICANQALRCGRAVGLQFHLEADLDKLPTWCKEYKYELPDVGKTAEQILSEYGAVAKRVNELCDLLMENFLQDVD
jgi:GMP synthase (glutamine-hydrolysing)